MQRPQGDTMGDTMPRAPRRGAKEKRGRPRAIDLGRTRQRRGREVRGQGRKRKREGGGEAEEGPYTGPEGDRCLRLLRLRLRLGLARADVW